MNHQQHSLPPYPEKGHVVLPPIASSTSSGMHSPPDAGRRDTTSSTDANRRRAARACDGCRRVKEKCEGGVPCRRCSHLRRQCQFSKPTGRSRSGIAPSGVSHASGSEPEQNMPELLRRMSNMERLLVHFVGDIKLDGDTLQNLADSVGKVKGSLPSAAEHEAIEASSDTSEHVKVDEITVQPLDNNATHYSGEFSHWNFSMRIKNWIEQTGPHRTDAPDAPKIKEFYRYEELQSPSDAAGLSSSFPPRHITDFLAKAFFNHAVSNYFYVDRTWLNRKMDAVFENPASISRRDVPTLCIVYMVLAIGTQYAYLDSRGNRASPDSGPFSEDNLGVMLYQQACRLLPDVITIASMESVQACLLIGLYTLPLDPSGLSWTYLNLAMKLAIQNGMHRKYPGQGLDPATRETRTRVWWVVYALEKRVGTFHGRPISISESEIDVDWPVDRPEIWPGSPPKNTANQLATLHLCRTLGFIGHEISRFKMYDKQITYCALARLVDIKDELHRWWNDLPNNVCCRDSTIEGAISRESIHVKLEYCVLRMYSGRLFIMPRNTVKTHPTSASPAFMTDQSSPASAVSSRNADRRAILVADCVDAALCIIDTCRLLQNTIGLARASYTEFSGLRVALLVILSQFLMKQGQGVDNLRQPLCEGMTMLKHMSTWGASARFDVSLIEAFEFAIARMEAKESSNPTSSLESDYDMFKKWETGWTNTVNTQQQQQQQQPPPAEDKAFDPSEGIPSVVSNASGTWASWAPKQAAGSISAGSPGTSFMGMEGNFASVPMLESLSATLGQGYGFDVDLDNAAAGAGRPNGWMGF